MSICVFSSNCKKNLSAFLGSHTCNPSDFGEECCKECECSFFLVQFKWTFQYMVMYSIFFLPFFFNLGINIFNPKITSGGSINI